MAMFNAKDRQTIWKTIDILISHKRKIAVRIERQSTAYASRIIKASYMEAYSKYGNGPHLIIGELSPEHGYSFIRSGQPLIVKFVAGNTPCGFKTLCLGCFGQGPDRKIVVGFPESMRLPERRRGRRGSREMPEFTSVVLAPAKGLKPEKNCDFPITDYSTKGVGIFVSEEDSDLIGSAQKGDRLKDIILFSSEAMVKVDGTVRHKSKRKRRGRQGEDAFILGIEFDEALMDFNVLQ